MRARRQHPRRLPLQLSAARLPRRRCHERRLLRRFVALFAYSGPSWQHTAHTRLCGQSAVADWRVRALSQVLRAATTPFAQRLVVEFCLARSLCGSTRKKQKACPLTLCLLLCPTIGLTTMSPLARHCLQAAHRSTDIRKRLRVGDRRHGRRSAGRRAASHVLLPPPWRRLLCSAGEQGLWLT